ncbi:bifunctional adenosylcobalamin biosynthesis protein CobP [Roseibium sp. TrichSKD4]|uniref:bifunctional adenosylcobinamide kinase/adenosylcobinamide-phosphate guanylyltransferase n=1 Tax=Roseibium sp. TrichSKD4 TaxID=744980 RepID=UPI0001E562AC|nr:bifunctional adenosylcobinamide kinase/adenosylcobinamide-phosphate guanylyltransferase [Roseibium sp. TrichSKD4]EFO33832.1 bifunctional adenosylcobalamin biosynthesis protein CobP [Roseibium sp. TrichSKD4]
MPGRAYSGGARSTLVFGGARSGKSRFAEDLCLQSGLERVYLATSVPFDAEMTARVESHKQQRGSGWTTIEEPLDIAGALETHAAPGRVILIDCLTVWLNNLLYEEKDVAAEAERLTQQMPTLQGPCVFVSNEVGHGIVPENRLARAFRDVQGRLNQDIAAASAQVVFVAAGQPILLKPRKEPEITL